MQIFLDCDGVLADFDFHAAEILGISPREFEANKGKAEFWDRIYASEDFFFKLPKMEDADILVTGVFKRGFEPVILTGIPSKNNSDWAIPQKLRWRDVHYPKLKMITCKSKNKFQHMVSDKHNILIDDWEEHKHIWENAGGTFITHTNAISSLEKLDEVISDRKYNT